jgi:hypothetical protein
MTSLVQELQRDALHPDVAVVELLQKSLVVATKLKQDEFLKWVNQELDGYGNAETPDYREVHGAPKVHNPYRGWEPLFFETAKTTERFSKMNFNMTAGELEHSLVERGGKGQATFAVSYHAEVAANLQESIGYKYEIALFVNATQFQRILNAVRKIILQWALKLEEAGVTGDGTTFSAHDQKAASHVTYNIQNYPHGKFDRSQIQVDTESSSQSVVVKPLDFKAIGAFLATLEQQAEALKLSSETQAERIAEIRTVEAKIKSPSLRVLSFVSRLVSLARSYKA